MALKKGEMYNFVVTHAGATETRTDRQKVRAVARLKKAMMDADGPAEGVLNFQSAEEELNALTRYVKDEKGHITEQDFPIEAPGEDPEEE